jgi:hypothetical protein
LSAEILLDEHVGEDGSLLRTKLRNDEGRLVLVEPDGERLLPEGALDAVFARFGGELADDVKVADDGLDVGNGARLTSLRHLARYDVIARDYLVHANRDAIPRVALGVTIAGALRHLARAAERNAP